MNTIIRPQQQQQQQQKEEGEINRYYFMLLRKSVVLQTVWCLILVYSLQHDCEYNKLLYVAEWRMLLVHVARVYDSLQKIRG